MGRSNQANLKKTIYFLKRNGLRRTWYAVRERMEERKQPPYLWRPPTEEQLAAQRAWWEARRERASRWLSASLSPSTARDRNISEICCNPCASRRTRNGR